MWSTIVDSVPVGNGVNPWIVPNTPSSQCLVRIGDVDHPSVNDVSDNTFTIDPPVSVEDLNSGIPEEYGLSQNYPNPFNPSTTINFALPEAANVSLNVYNALGQKIEEILDTNLEAGYYRYHWDASNIPTGMYIYELRTNKFVSVKKMLLLK